MVGREGANNRHAGYSKFRPVHDPKYTFEFYRLATEMILASISGRARALQK